MNASRVRTVARWEFLRFAKPKDLLIGTLMFAVVFGASSNLGRLAGKQIKTAEEPSPADATEAPVSDDASANTLLSVAVFGDEVPGVDPGPLRLAPFRLVRADASGDSLEARLARGDLAAVLIVQDEGPWQIRMPLGSPWFSLLEDHIRRHLRTEKVRALGLDPVAETQLLAEPRFEAAWIDPDAGADEENEGGSVMTTVLAVALMMMGLFLGFSYVFVAITAEKTQRTTESLLSALRPQEWIDGKILGLTGVVFINLVTTVIGYLIYQAFAHFVLGRDFQFPSVFDPSVLSITLALATLGFFFWFTLFAMIAATIDDPNSSSRSSFLLLPFLPLSAVFAGLNDADALWMRVFSMTPGISPVAMPVRLLRGDPQWWEIAVALVLLAAGAMLFRSAAGRMFGTSMLMTGKEPSLAEVWRWIRAS